MLLRAIFVALLLLGPSSYAPSLSLVSSCAVPAPSILMGRQLGRAATWSSNQVTKAVYHLLMMSIASAHTRLAVGFS